MTDESNRPQDEEVGRSPEVPPPVEPPLDASLAGFAAETQALFESDFDAEAALNAIISGAAAAELEEVLDEAGEPPPPPLMYEPIVYQPALAMPPPDILRRGAVGSVMPALALIALGAWLTVTNSVGLAPPTGLVTAVVICALALVLLAHWLAGGRWSRGLLFVGLLIPGIAAFGFATFEFALIDFVRGWPLLLAIAGACILLTAVLGRPVSRRWFAPGILLIVAGIVGTLALLGFVPGSMLIFVAQVTPVICVAVVILLLLPFVVRRRA
jgi:hypothetical protein